VYALQAQGLDGQAKPYLRIEDMAAHYIKEMRSVQPQGPYYLMGASFGGLIIFEMAHQLLVQGEKVALLAMLNTNCPVYSLLHRMRCHAGHLVQYGTKVHTQNLIGAVSRRLRKSAAPTNNIDLSNRELQQALESLPDSDDPLVEVTLAIVQAEKDYIPSNKIYPGKITLFWANDAERDFEDNRLGWKRLAAGGLDVHVVPGDHTSIREEPNVAVLVEKLKTCLERARLANVNGGTMAFSMETSK
jgi:thioesterase domain-containing protein